MISAHAVDRYFDCHCFDSVPRSHPEGQLRQDGHRTWAYAKAWPAGVSVIQNDGVQSGLQPMKKKKRRHAE
jgi:hypothetical protein